MDLEALVSDLRDAFDTGLWYEVLIPYLADVVAVAHHPEPTATDGPTTAADLAADMRATHYAGAVREMREVADSITVEGPSIVMDGAMVATFHDGQVFRFGLRQVYTFEGERMVVLDHYPDAAGLAPFRAAIVAAAAAR